MVSAITELPEAPEEMLTVAEVADVLKISFPYARRLVMGDRGKCPAITSVKIGRLRRVRRSDLDAYIRNLSAA